MNDATEEDFMAKIERLREAVRGPLDQAYLEQKTQKGWRLVAAEWQREVEGDIQEAGAALEEVPYGLRVASDGYHLEENPAENLVLTIMMELIVQDEPLSKIAEELNRRGLRTRDAAPWNPISAFNLLPRLVEVGPRIFSTEEWAERRRHLMRVI